MFGTSAAFITANIKAAVHPRAGRDLSALRAVGSTGSALSPEGFRWVYEQLGAHVWLFSTSGGTDVCTAFLASVPTLPVYEGELQARALGCDVQAWDEGGCSVVGATGELVIVKPMPSMPVFIWDDTDGAKYKDAYFDVYPGVWRHGDWLEITDRGTGILHGRSDATINRSGIRIGTAEIYRSVLAVEEVLDAVVVDLPREGYEDGWMPLFVVLRDGATLTPSLAARITARLRADCSARHVPNDVFQVPEIPRTASGKVPEVPIKRILMGEEPARALSVGSLANPGSLATFVTMASELQDSNAAGSA